MTFTIYTDGGALNNPGQAAIAYAIYLDNELIAKYSKTIGIATNNIAEYTALLEALKYISSIIDKHTVSSIKVFADSLLMINQVNGLYKVKDKALGKLLWKIRSIEQQINKPISYTHIVREKNTFADSLVKKKLGKCS